MAVVQIKLEDRPRMLTASTGTPHPTSLFSAPRVIAVNRLVWSSSQTLRKHNHRGLFCVVSCFMCKIKVGLFYCNLHFLENSRSQELASTLPTLKWHGYLICGPAIPGDGYLFGDVYNEALTYVSPLFLPLAPPLLKDTNIR